MMLKPAVEMYGDTDKQIDERIVKEYLKVITKADVLMINRWTSHADVPVNKLIEFTKKIKHIEPVKLLPVYRGIGFNLSYQEKMNLYEKKFLMNFLKPGVKPGYEFSYATPRPLSFTDDLSTARAFGSTIITSVFDERVNYLRITHSFWEACNRLEAASLFQETILLDINKKFDYTVLDT